MSAGGVPGVRAEAEAEDRIDLAWTPITPPMAAKIVEAIHTRTGRETVHVVDLIDNGLGSELTADIAAAVETSDVRELMLRFNKIGKNGCDALSSSVKVSTRIQLLDLRGNDLSGGDVRRLLKAASESSSLSHLGLGMNRLGPDGAEKVAEVACQNAGIIHVDLNSNNLGPEGASHIARAIANRGSCLRVLDLFGNSLGPDGVTTVLTALRSNRTIQRLVLGNNACGDASMPALREALFGNAVLTDLDLCCNDITSDGIAQAADGFSFCASLTRLSLRDNAFNATGALHTFAKACALSDSLLSIDVGSCGLGSKGAIMFEGCLASSSSLTELNLSYNHVDDVAADGIAKAMTISKRLRVLDLVGNSLAPPGAELLLDALQRNPNIKSLALQGNANLPRAVHKKLESLLLARRGEEYRRGTNEVPPIRRPATLPFD